MMKRNIGRLWTVCLYTLASVCIPAQAAAPQVRAQAPGFFRMMVGETEVTALSDGTKTLPFDQLLHNIAPDRLTALLAAAHLQEPVENSSAAFLINTGAKLVLVDTGAGTMWDASLGKVGRNLVLSGYRPDQVDVVLLTHLHFDHAGGLLDGDKMAYPNATVWVAKDEAAFWLDPARRAKAPDAQKGVFDDAVKALSPYMAAGHLKTFSGSHVFAPGITSVPTPGHTPGDTSYLVESNGNKLMVWGDVVHLAAVQFADPDATIAFDSAEPDAVAQRKRAFADAAQGGYWTASSHIPFPGIGHVNAEGDHYRFVPANYVTLFPPQGGMK